MVQPTTQFLASFLPIAPFRDSSGNRHAPASDDSLGVVRGARDSDNASPSLASRLSGWDPFAIDSRAGPHNDAFYPIGIATPGASPMGAERIPWTPFDTGPISEGSPAGGNGALGACPPLYQSPLSAVANGGPLPGTRFGFTDGDPGGAVGVSRDGIGGANVGPQGLSSNLPFSPFSEDSEVGLVGPPGSLLEVPGAGPGTSRVSGSLPPRPASGSGPKSSGSGRAVGQLSFEPRSESWGSFTSAAAPIQDVQDTPNGILGNLSADLESWGSFRQPSEDGAGPANELSESVSAADSQGRGCRAVVHVVSENGKGFGVRGREHLVGPLRSQSEGPRRTPEGAVPAKLSASEVSPLDAAKSSPGALPPRHDSALEMDLLSRFMQEAVGQRKP